jgi:HEAT repeat protein
MNEIETWSTALRSADATERAAAAEQLCHAGADAAPACVELVRACADEEAVREWAVAALEELGPPPQELLEPLIQLVSNDNATVAYWAVTLLARLGPAAIASEPKVVAILQGSPDEAVRERAASALGTMGAKSEESLAALEIASKAQSPRLARLAKASLELVQK